MNDPFAKHARGLDAPASRHAAITPSDNADLPIRPRVIYCLSGGSAVLRDEAGTDVTYNLAAGQVLPMSPVRVRATGTTASLVGWW